MNISPLTFLFLSLDANFGIDYLLVLKISAVLRKIPQNGGNFKH